MVERFTERARQVVLLAQEEARLLGHDHVGTEHLLLGLVREQDGVAADVLHVFDVTVEAVRANVAGMVGGGNEVATAPTPFTPSATTALERAWNEALLLGDTSVDTHHLLLGLLRVKEGVAARILLDFGADAEKIRHEINGALSVPGRGTKPPRPRSRQASEDDPNPPSQVAVWHSDEPAHLTVACPNCATPIETITTEGSNTRFQVSAEGDRACPGCGRQWTIAYTVTWEQQVTDTDASD